LYFRIGNRGTIPFAGSVDVMWVQSSNPDTPGGMRSVDLDLASGAISGVVLELDQGSNATLIQIEPGAADCRSDNDTLEFAFEDGGACHL
jgi:hypothetical protein